MYKEILLPVDIAHLGAENRAVEVACELAKTHGARLNILAVVPDYGMPIVGSFFPEGFEGEVMGHATKELAAFIGKAVPGDLPVRQHLARGTVYEEVLRMAKGLSIDLIVMAARRPELKDYLLGPNAARVVRHAGCSVLVVRD